MKKIELKVPQYYVPPCPACKSRCTGRYMRKPLMEGWYVEEKSLENAEIVRFVKREPVKNCFCVDCGHEWGQMVSVRFITKEELEEEKEARGTKDAFEALHEENELKIRKRKKNPALKAFHWVFG